ncbi:hypothetical protein FQR65_LT16376 [Abscondita terminalis]|nr:hypothetical protein FQR65_LT16376 [Abscondita terminalis]
MGGSLIQPSRVQEDGPMGCKLLLSGDKPTYVETAYASREEGGDDVKSSRPLRPGPHTCYNGRYREQPPSDRMRISKAGLSSDWSLQLDSVKLESLVIAHQPWRGEYVPGPCTHRPSSHGSWGYLKSVTVTGAA